VPKISTFFAAVLLAVIGFASAAEAHGPNFYASPFFRNQGRPEFNPHHCGSNFALERARERQFAEMRAQQAAGAAKRSRFAALRRGRTAKFAAVNAASQPRQTANAAAAMTPAKKGNLLPATKETSSAKTATAATETSTSTSETKVSAVDTCRKYSAAADGLVDTPCL
jgi:hypothetical protein